MICHFLCFIIYHLTFKHMFTKASTGTMSYFSWRISGIKRKVYTITSAWLQNISKQSESLSVLGGTTVLCLLIPDLTVIYRDWNLISHWNEKFPHCFKPYQDLIPGDYLLLIANEIFHTEICRMDSSAYFQQPHRIFEKSSTETTVCKHLCFKF